MEVTYHASILKKKLHDNDVLPHDEMKNIFNKALRTLKSKMLDLLLQRQFASIKDQYTISNSQ